MNMRLGPIFADLAKGLWIVQLTYGLELLGFAFLSSTWILEKGNSTLVTSAYSTKCLSRTEQDKTKTERRVKKALHPK